MTVGPPIEALSRAWREMMELASLAVVARGWRVDQCSWATVGVERATLYVGLDGPPVVGQTMPGTPVFEMRLVVDLSPAEPTITVHGKWLCEIPVPP